MEEKAGLQRIGKVQLHVGRRHLLGRSRVVGRNHHRGPGGGVEDKDDDIDDLQFCGAAESLGSEAGGGSLEVVGSGRWE